MISMQLERIKRELMFLKHYYLSFVHISGTISEVKLIVFIKIIIAHICSFFFQLFIASSLLPDHIAPDLLPTTSRTVPLHRQDILCPLGELHPQAEDMGDCLTLGVQADHLLADSHLREAYVTQKINAFRLLKIDIHFF